MRKVALTAGGAALALALSACGDDQDSDPVFDSMQNLVSAAEEGTDDSQTANFSMELEMGGITATATGEGRFTSEDPAVSMTMDTAGQESEMRLVDNVMYVENPMAAMADGASWMKFDPGDDNPLTQPMDGALDEMASQSDVRNLLEQMETGGTITDSEETELHGEPATHYSIDLNMKEVMEKHDEAMGVPENDAEQFQEKMPETVPVELWLNEDQLPMQLTMEMDDLLEATGLPVESAEPMVLEYTDWGTDVDIEAPADEDITDFGDLGDIGDVGEAGDAGDLGDIGDLDDLEDVLPN